MLRSVLYACAALWLAGCGEGAPQSAQSSQSPLPNEATPTPIEVVGYDCAALASVREVTQAAGVEDDLAFIAPGSIRGDDPGNVLPGHTQCQFTGPAGTIMVSVDTGPALEGFETTWSFVQSSSAGEQMSGVGDAALYYRLPPGPYGLARVRGRGVRVDVTMRSGDPKATARTLLMLVAGRV